MVAKAHGGGASFGSAAAYCLGLDRETQDADREAREGPAVVCRPEPSARVEWSEIRNLATDDVRTAARQMAATTQYAGELKRLAGGSQAGRPLSKPVYHYTLSWAKDETPGRAEMSRAVAGSLKALGMEDRQAFVVAHNDKAHPHVHVVVNRVSAEDGRAVSRGNDRLKLSRWAERWEREHGGVRCERRAAHNGRRESGEWVIDRKAVPDARYRRRAAGQVARPPIKVEARRHVHERWRDVVDAAQRRIHERRVHDGVHAAAEPVRAQMETAHRAEWAELLTRQERDREAGVEAGPEGIEADQHRERAELGREQGREARQFEEQLGKAYAEGMKHQPPGWEDSPELSAEIEQLGGLSPHGRASLEAHQREARWQREGGRSPEVDHGRGGFER